MGRWTREGRGFVFGFVTVQKELENEDSSEVLLKQNTSLFCESATFQKSDYYYFELNQPCLLACNRDSFE